MAVLAAYREKNSQRLTWDLDDAARVAATSRDPAERKAAGEYVTKRAEEKAQARRVVAIFRAVEGEAIAARCPWCGAKNRGDVVDARCRWCGGYIGACNLSHTVASVKLAGVDLELGAGPTSQWGAWAADAARKVGGCAAGGFISAKGTAVPFLCGHSMCPRCRGRRADASAERHGEVLVPLAKAGCPMVMATNTLRPSSWLPEGHEGPRLDRPVMLTEAEKRLGYAGRSASPGEVAYPQGGDGIAVEWPRLKAVWQRFRETRAAKRLLGQTVGYVYGVESTARIVAVDAYADKVADRWSCRACGASGPRGWVTVGGKPRPRVLGACPACRARWIPREHVHVHTVFALRPGVDPEAWGNAWRAAWVRYAGEWAVEGAQDARTVPVERVRYAVKYPTKLSERTAAQVVAWYAATRGTKPHQCGGGLHNKSGLGALAQSWAAADADDRATLEETASVTLGPGVPPDVVRDILGALARVEVEEPEDASPPLVATMVRRDKNAGLCRLNAALESDPRPVGDPWGLLRGPVGTLMPGHAAPDAVLQGQAVVTWRFIAGLEPSSVVLVWTWDPETSRYTRGWWVTVDDLTNVFACWRAKLAGIDTSGVRLLTA